jgi:GAF domain-containing protein
MRRFVRFFDSLPSSWRILLSAVAQATPFYVTALLRYHIGEVAKRASVPVLLTDAGVVVVVLAAILAVRGYFEAVRREAAAVSEHRRTTLARAHDLVERLVSLSLADITGATTSPETDMLFSSRDRLMRIVQAAYDLLEGAFRDGLEPAIGFEATFMTKSYRDGFITIPAYANRDGRAPVSLQLREHNPKLYEQTVTALVYQAASPSIRIVEDTEKDPGVNSLYEGQKRRIKSMLVFPVRDGENRLLGTLVVHCDRPGFFKNEDEKFWTVLLEVFAKRLAHEKAKMDRVVQLAAVGPRVEVVVPELPF